MTEEDRRERQNREVERNFEAFQKLLPGLLDEHFGEIAVMRDGKLFALYPTMEEAGPAARKEFPDGFFSYQEVDDEPADFGGMSYAFMRD